GALVERVIFVIERIAFPLRYAILAAPARALDLPDPVGRSPQVVFENRQLGLFIFAANLRWRELARGDEGGGLRDVQGLGIDRDRQRRPFAPELRGHGQADHARAEHRPGGTHFGYAHLMADGFNVLADHAAAAPAQGNAGLAMS